MTAAITKLPEWKCLTKFIHAKFPKHNLMLRFVFPYRFNFIIAKKSSLPFICRDKLDEYDPRHLSYSGIEIEKIIAIDPMLGMYVLGLSEGGLEYGTALNFMTHSQLKDNVKFFKFLFDYLATGHGHCDHYESIRAKADNSSPWVSEDDPLLWHCLDKDEHDSLLEKFMIMNDMHAAI